MAHIDFAKWKTFAAGTLNKFPVFELSFGHLRWSQAAKHMLGTYSYFRHLPALQPDAVVIDRSAFKVRIIGEQNCNYIYNYISKHKPDIFKIFEEQGIRHPSQWGSASKKPAPKDDPKHEQKTFSTTLGGRTAFSTTSSAAETVPEPTPPHKIEQGSFADLLLTPNKEITWTDEAHARGVGRKNKAKEL